MWLSSPLPHAFHARWPTPSNPTYRNSPPGTRILLIMVGTSTRPRTRGRPGRSRPLAANVFGRISRPHRTARCVRSDLDEPADTAIYHPALMPARGGGCGFRRLSLTPSLFDDRPHPIKPYRDSPPRMLLLLLVTSTPRRTRVRPGRSRTLVNVLGMGSHPPRTARCVRLGRGSQRGCHLAPMRGCHVERWWVCVAFVASHPRLLARRPTPFNPQKLAAVDNGGYIYTSPTLP